MKSADLPNTSRLRSAWLAAPLAGRFCSTGRKRPASGAANHPRRVAAFKAFVVFILASLLTAHAAQDDSALAPAIAPSTAPADAAVRFGALDVFVDTGEQQLAAYQV